MSEHVHVSRNGHVVRMTLARPDKKNALTGAMYLALCSTIEACQSDGTRAMVLCGEQGVFTAGNDIVDFLQAGGGGDLAQLPAFKFISLLARNQIPLIAAIDGLAIGIGTTLILHCDLVYATARTSFRMPFVDLGLVPEAASSLLVPQRVGYAKSAQWMMLGEPFSAQEALQFGLVNAIVEPDGLVGHAMAAAEKLCAKPVAALAATRRLLRGDSAPLLQQIDTEKQAFAAGMKSTEARAIFAAFLAKSKG